MSRCDIVPGTATCGCVHVNATVYLYGTLRFPCVCVYTSVGYIHGLVGLDSMLPWKDPWAGNQKI